jgi:hypothetical protein
MNRFLEEQRSMLDGIHGMRNELLDAVTEADLAFSPGGDNMTLGALCREIGEIQHSYTESLKTFKHDWDTHSTEVGLKSSVAKLKAWYQTLDANLISTISALSDDDFKKTIDRGFPMPIEFQLQAYIQAMLISLGKATIFLRAMNKPLPENIKQWIW